MIFPLPLTALEQPLEARLLGREVTIAGFTTDSRQVQPGDLFVALTGERFDGHDYVATAQRAGASAALTSRDVDTDLPVLRVADTGRALGLLGAYARRSYTGPLVAITGSVGKTTVKNLLRSVLSMRGSTRATAGNLNNEIGVPLTLLGLDATTEFAVVEMGATRAGDIAWLCELARPSIAVVLNVMQAHLQGFGDVASIAAAKGEIYDGLGAGGIAIINADQPWARQWRQRAGAAAVLDYGLRQPAALSARAISSRGAAGISFIASTPAGESPVTLLLPGLHNVGNALAAIAVGLACELSLSEITAGLASVTPTPGRLSTSRRADGVTVIDDCYNANPGSVRAAIDLLAGFEGRRTLVLGAMLELGAASEQLHAEVGDYAREKGIERLWGVGPELAPTVTAFGSGRQFEDRAAVIAALPNEFGQHDTVLVKGSRGAAMEQVLAALLTLPNGAKG